MTQVGVPTSKVHSTSEPEIRVFRERLSHAGIDPRSRQPKIDQMKPPRALPSAEDKITGLDVAVHDSLPMKVLDDIQLQLLSL